MAIVKSYTDLQQSKKLAEILQTENADMCYEVGEDLDGYMTKTIYTPLMHTPYNNNYIPCWSLAALLSVLDFPSLTQNKEDEWEVCVPNCETDGYIEVSADNPVDACVEIVIKLHELNLL